MGGPCVLLDCFLQGLGSFWKALGRFGVTLVVLGLALRAFGSIAGHRQETQRSLWQTVAAKSMVLRDPLGAFESTLGAVGSIREDLRGPPSSF